VSVRIAHLSDPHFGGENAPAAQAALAVVEALEPTAVVVTGDVTLNGLPREFRAAAAWLGQLPAPVVVTPGNHDTPYWNLPLRALDPFARYRRYIGRAMAAGTDAPGLAIRAVNSARGAQPRLNWSKGVIDLDAVEALDWGGAQLRVFACHHPLLDIAGAPVTGGVHRGAEAAARLSSAGVELVLTGHVHNPFVVALPGGPIPGYAVGAGTLSLRTRGAPAGFSTITVDDGQIEIASLAWDGSAFQTARTWAFARLGR
jgi:3',5'-cyclic AMP phosphodiesterase CpdA